MMTSIRPIVSALFAASLLASPAMVNQSLSQESGAISAKDEGDSRFDDGFKEKEKKDGLSKKKDKLFEEAVDAYNRALRIQGEADYPEASLGLGKAYLELEEYAEAKRAFEDALFGFESNPEEYAEQIAETYNGLGKALLESATSQNDIATAVQKFDEAVKIERNNPKYLLNQGEAYLKGGAAAKAEVILTRTIERTIERSFEDDAENAEAYDLRGQARARLKKFEKAQADFTEAIQRDPTDKEFFYNSGIAYLGAEDFPQAIRRFTESMEADKKVRDLLDEDEKEDEPLYIEPLAARAQTLLEVGKLAPADHKLQAYQAAIADCNVGLQLVPDQPTFLFMRGVALRLAGEMAPAIESFSRALQLQPQYGEAYLRRGIVWYYLDDLELAIADFSEAARINFQDVRPNMWHGFTLVKQDKFRDAIIAYSEALIKDRTYGPAYNNRGLAYMHLREYDRAIEDFNSAIRSDPSDASAYLRRGIAHQQLGQNEKAAASVAAAVGHNPKSPAAHRKLAELYRILNRQELADQHLAQADELDKTGSLSPSPESNTASGMIPSGDAGATPDFSSFLEGMDSLEGMDTSSPLDNSTTPDSTGSDLTTPTPFDSTNTDTPETPGSSSDLSDSSTDPVVPVNPGLEDETPNPDNPPNLFDSDLFPE